MGWPFEQIGATGGTVGHFRSVRGDPLDRPDTPQGLRLRLHAQEAGRLPGPHQIGRTQTAGQSHYGINLNLNF